MREPIRSPGGCLLVLTGEACDGALQLSPEQVRDDAVVEFQVETPRLPRLVQARLEVTAGGRLLVAIQGTSLSFGISA